MERKHLRYYTARQSPPVFTAELPKARAERFWSPERAAMTAFALCLLAGLGALLWVAL